MTLSDPRIAESSGLVASTLHPGVLWTHNDSGDTSRVYAVGPDGRTRSVYAVDVAPARDWETITSTKSDSGTTLLWIGDIGDNNAVRTKGILVHRVAEPRELQRTGTLSATSYRLRYDDGPHDAEAMFFAADGRLRVVTKSLLAGEIYLAPARLSPTGVNLLTRVGTAPPLVTDAVSLAGGGYALRTYTSVLVYDSAGVLLSDSDLPAEPQGESLAVTPDGRFFLVGSEGADSAVWRVPIPAAARPAGAPAPASSATASRRTPTASASSALPSPSAGGDDETPLSPLRLSIALAGVAALSVATAFALRRRG